MVVVGATAMVAAAQSGGGDSVDAERAIEAFAVQMPDEGSPFFADRELARLEQERNARRRLEGASGVFETAIYPDAGSAASAGEIFRRFFTEMFSSVRLWGRGGASMAGGLEVNPAEFSLSDRREVEVVFRVRNDGRRIMRLDFPTSQGLEILVMDGQGKVVERWSDDRMFEAREEVTFVNPGERIEFREMVPTREMKAGETYEIRGEVPGYPDFTAGRQVTPLP